MEEESKLKELYNKGAENFLFTRTKNKDIYGFYNREIEQPLMFETVPKDLKRKKLLDLGCGPGIHLKEYIKRGAEGHGLDLSANMIKLAKEHCPKGSFTVGSIYKTEYEESSFDIITASFSIDHISDLNKALKEISRILKKDGLFIFSVPHPVVNMFRNDPHQGFKPTHGYFDNTVIHCAIVKDCEEFVDYPRTLQEYFDVLIENNFVLERFIENKPKEEWKKKYKEITETHNIYKVPQICFFKMRLQA